MYQQVFPLPITDPKAFDGKEFSNPSNDAVVSYNWIWASPLSCDGIRRHLDEMYEGGIRSVCIIPEPPEFRPEMCPTDLTPAYLSDDYMDMFRYAVEYAKSKGMDFWLYDEGGWPSGMANGLTCQDHPEYEIRALARKERVLKAGEAYSPAEDAVAAFVADKTRIAAGYTPDAEETVVEYTVFHPVLCNNKYPDILNPEASARFIDKTHERYREAVGDLLGETVRYFFTDEPAASNVQWSLGTEELFKEAYGYDLTDYIPALFATGELSEREQQVRMDYCDWCATRFAENYLGQLQSWCRKNGMLSVGHLGGDDVSDGSGKFGYRHVLRTLRKFDVPGVDAIMHQISNRRPGSVYYRFGDRYIPVGANHFFPRFASSAAAQTGSRYALTESFGVYAPSGAPNFECMRYVVGFQMARGINIINAMSVGFGPQEGVGRSGAGGSNKPSDPSYIHLHAWLDSTARQSYALSLGDPATETALYLSVRDQWASTPSMNAAVAAFDKAGVILESVPCDFDVVDDDFLEQAALESGVLSMGLAHYKTVVVPACVRMTDAARKALEAFAAQGGRVLQVSEDGAEPALTIAGASVVSPATLGSAVTPTATVLSLETEGGEAPVHEGDPSVRVRKRVLPDGALYYVFNEAMAAQRFTLRFAETMPCYRLDTEDGSVRRLSGTAVCRAADGVTDVDFSLCSGESALLLFTDAAVDAVAEDAFRVLPPVPVAELTDFTVSQTMSMEIGKQAVETHFPARRAVPTALGDWRPLYGEAFTGRAEYETHFALPADWDGELLLSLGEVRHSCDVYVNGRHQGTLYAHPYRLVLDKSVLKAYNSLRVCVANTAADQHLHAGIVEDYDVNILGPYYDTSVKFTESVAGGGLFGPVTLTTV